MIHALWASLAIPVIIHLVYQRKAEPLPFSTLYFLKQIDQRVHRRYRLKEFLLLLLRILLLAAVIGALHRPMLQSGFSQGGKVPTTAGIVLDDTCSMRAVHEGTNAYTRGKKAAQVVLKGLTGRDKALVVPFAARDEDLRRKPTAPGKELARLKSMKCGYAQATLSSALKRTLDGLKESETRRKEIYIVTDMQKLAWDEGITQQTRRVLDDKKFKDMPLFLVDVGVVVPTNLTVTRADFGTRMNVEGSVSNLFATVKNTGSQGIIQGLSLHIDDDKIHETEVGTNAGQTKNITVEHTFERKGFYTGFVELDPDDLPADNRRYFTVEVSDKVPLLIVNGDPSVIPHQDGSFYLSLALGGMSKNNASLSPIEPRVITDRELQSERLSNYATVVLANVSTITPQMAQSLTNYVRNGGGLLIFLGHNVEPASYNMAIGKAAEETVEVVAHKGGENPDVKEKKDVARSFELLPANLGQVRTPKGEDAYFSVWNQNARHPILRDIIRDIKLNRAQIKRFFALQESPDHGTTGTELITLNAGPLMVERKFGSGSVILFTISCTPGWSNIPLKPFFLPLLHQTIYYLARTSSQRSSTPVGMAYRLPIPEVEETTKVSFYPPPTEEQKREGHTPEPITVKSELGRAGHSAIFKQTNRPGIYRAEVAVGKALRRELFAVNVPVKESNLSRIPVSEVQKRIDLEDFTIVEDPEKLGQIVRRAREGLPLWDYFLLAALLLALATSYIGNVVLKHGASETEETV